MSTSRISCKFERFLFKGIPEQPEPIWERNANTNIRERQTGKSQNKSSVNNIKDKSKIIGFITYDFDKKTEEFTPIK